MTLILNAVIYAFQINLKQGLCWHAHTSIQWMLGFAQRPPDVSWSCFLIVCALSILVICFTLSHLKKLEQNSRWYIWCRQCYSSGLNVTRTKCVKYFIGSWMLCCVLGVSVPLNCIKGKVYFFGTIHFYILFCAIIYNAVNFVFLF